MKDERSKNTLTKSNFHLAIINELKIDTNLGRIGKRLGLRKENLNYYLRQLKKQGFITHKGRGWYELNKKSKNLTKYGNFLSKDISRGHAYVWKVNLTKKPKNWDKRIEILKKNDVNYKLVGAMKNTPRIKALGRKVWLCNNHLRIFDKGKSSYYGDTAKEVRNTSFRELLLIVGVLERKLGLLLRPLSFSYQKEHYALIKNDLAIDQNRKGIIWRIKDESGEWLLIDDSLEQGGELETVGKKAYKTNIPMQTWWNDNKKHNFKVTPSFLLENINQVVENQKMFNQNFESHVKSIKQLGNSAESNAQAIELLSDVILQLKEKINH